MALANVALTDTFDVWRVRTNQIIISLDQTSIATTAAFALANADNTYATAAFAKANSANYFAFLVNTNTVSAFTHANGAFIQANAAFAQANIAVANVNYVNTAMQTSFAKANSANIAAGAAFDKANGAFTHANGAFTQANGAFTQANGAFTQANAAFAQANSVVTSLVAGTGMAVSAATGAVTVSVVTSLGAVGTYAFLAKADNALITAGTTYAGSGLRFTGIQSNNIDATATGGCPGGYAITGGVAITLGATPSGTWQAMGTVTAAGNKNYTATLFIRTV